jgi:hypothetical protein
VGRFWFWRKQKEVRPRRSTKQKCEEREARCR